MKIKVVMVVILLAITQLLAAPFYTYASFRSSGTLSGGLRYVLNEHACLDASVGGAYDDDGLNTDVYFDAFFYKCALGTCVIASKPKEGDIVTSAALLYCFEKQISQGVFIDVMPILLSKTFQANTGFEFLSGWDIAIVLEL